MALGLFINANAQIINFPDANFKAKLVASNVTYPNIYALNSLGNPIKIDTNNNGEIETSEALMVYSLLVSSSNISSLVGVENFLNIKTLECNSNQLTNLNISSLTSLENLNCSGNMISTIDLNNLINLKDLRCSSNNLSSLSLTNNLLLYRLYAGSNNNLISLNLSNLNNLYEVNVSYCSLINLLINGIDSLNQLSCAGNDLTVLDVSNCQNLANIWTSSNPTTSILLQNTPNLKYLECPYNNLSSIDVSDCPLFENLRCMNNPQLKSIFAKNGRAEYLNFANCPLLKYICDDEINLAYVEERIAIYNTVNCHVNSYCSFTSGGTYYTIRGNNKFDENNNGCDVADISLPNLKYTISNGTITGSLIANASGNYSVPVQAGTHTMTPVFENPSYFTASPSTVNVTFPTQSSPFNQNFCVTPNGVHPDLEVSILPINAARPGFDTKYKLIYKNKGNTTQSGTVNLAFNDTVLDFVSANPAVTTQILNNLSWNFNNLLPFETREVSFTLNVNSPTETPAVNGGDILNYTATITSLATDDLPNDNTFVFNQVVVNSYDPNDKTCLEGTTISPSKVGDYVHYMIRFENNGTANAHNIVVKDMIDANKFDVNSLIAVDGSHEFFTRINGNKVEFIFENINLPFDNANNDGYVAFKIKTKSTLISGDTFSNTASIYFDYNLPIVTNTVTTTIAALNRQDFDFANYFKLYPNPVHDVLNINSKENIEISSISIYNTLGQLVLVIPNAQNIKTVDVSNLSSGNYFIKINSDKGTSNTKFIKQ